MSCLHPLSIPISEVAALCSIGSPAIISAMVSLALVGIVGAEQPFTLSPSVRNGADGQPASNDVAIGTVMPIAVRRWRKSRLERVDCMDIALTLRELAQM